MPHLWASSWEVAEVGEEEETANPGGSGGWVGVGRGLSVRRGLELKLGFEARNGSRMRTRPCRRPGAINFKGVRKGKLGV